MQKSKIPQAGLAIFDELRPFWKHVASRARDFSLEPPGELCSNEGQIFRFGENYPVKNCKRGTFFHRA